MMIDINMQKKSGFTLVELMVGMVLSLIIIAAAGTVYLSSKKTNSVNQNIVNLQSDAQFALKNLREDIRSAGWTIADLSEQALPSPLGTGFADGGTGASDTLAIQYEGTADCNGAAPTSGSLITNTYDVVDGSLRCNGQPLADNVDSFQVLYGYGPSESDFNYVKASEIADPSLVHSIRFAVLMSSRYSSPDAPASASYDVLGETLSFSDKKIRRMYSGTAVVLNRPASLIALGG